MQQLVSVFVGVLKPASLVPGTGLSFAEGSRGTTPDLEHEKKIHEKAYKLHGTRQQLLQKLRAGRRCLQATLKELHCFHRLCSHSIL